MGHVQSAALPQRYPHLDWLRVFAMLGVFVFHSGRAFDSDGWHLKQPVGSAYFDLQTGLLSQWLMPMFFVISGWVTYTVLTRASAGGFTRSRLMRLGLPFVLGTLILVPPQVYIERVTQSGVTQNFLDWFPRYFDGLYAFGGNFAWMGLHLWYLEMLLLFSILLLPVFLWLRGPMRTLKSPDWTLPVLAGLALLVMELLVNQYPETWGIQDFGGWSPLTYLVWFMIGHEAGRSAQFQQGLIDMRWIAAAASLAGILVGIAIIAGAVPSPGYAVEFLLRIAVAWGGVAAMLGFAARHLTQPNAAISFANRYVLQFYVLHQTVIVMLGFWLLGWEANPFVKFLTTLAGSLAIIVAGLVVYNLAKAKARALIRPAAA